MINRQLDATTDCSAHGVGGIDVTRTLHPGPAALPERPIEARPHWIDEPSPGAGPSGLTPIEYLAMLARFWWLLVLLPVALAAVAFAYFSVAGRWYTATATLLVHPLEPTTPTAPPDVQAAILLARSYGQLAGSTDVLAATVYALRIPETAASLEPRVKARVEPDTQLITVSVDDRDPVQAAALANGIAANFIHWIGDRNVAVGAETVRVSLVAPADPPTKARGLGTSLYVVVAFGVGLTLAVLGAYVFDRLDGRIWSARDLRLAVDLPVVARLARPWWLWSHSSLVTVSSPLSTASDAYRALWMKLGLLSPHCPVRAIVVTSAGPMSGKSAITANLAISLAQAGQRVVLVDANLRRLTLDRLFQVQEHGGLSDLLAGAGGWISDHLVDGPVPELKLMLAGTSARREKDQFAVRPLELATAIELLIAALHASGNVVVVEAPSMLDASEALLFPSVASRLVVVVQEGQTRPAELAQALDDIRAMSNSPIHLVLADASW